MIQIRCTYDGVSRSDQPTISVGADETEPHMVALIVGSTENEFSHIGAHSRSSGTRAAIEEVRSCGTGPNVLLSLVEEIDRMDAALAQPQATCRTLHSDEARAVAAMLVHYANEAERR